MIYNFRFSSKEDYLSEILKIHDECGYQSEEYDFILEEFIEFCEVSGSGKR